MFTRRTLMLAGASCATALPRAQPSDDWDSAEPQSLGMRADAVAETLAAGETLPGLRALVVARHGKLVAERYYAGAGADQLQPIHSATKSVCALLVGLALRDGQLRSLDDTVAQLIPEAVADQSDSPAAPVTLRQLLSGRSGLVFDWTRFAQLATAKGLTRYVLGLPAVAAAPPGWSYNDAMVSLLAPILAKAQGADLATLAQRQLFDPLGIARFSWRRDSDGHPMAATGLALRPRDLLKLAAMMVAGGRWRSNPLVPESWVSQSMSPQGPASWRAGPVTDVGYGWLWFTGRLHGHVVAWAWGYGGQFALIAPGLQLAVATAATSPPPSGLRQQTDAVMALVGRCLEAAA